MSSAARLLSHYQKVHELIAQVKRTHDPEELARLDTEIRALDRCVQYTIQERQRR